jgi:hypothetical protein
LDVGDVFRSIWPTQKLPDVLKRRATPTGKKRLNRARLNCSARCLGHCAGVATMTFDLDLLFPIRDFASAHLMVLKAACLWNAGIISDRQRQLVEQRAQRFLEREPRGGPSQLRPELRIGDVQCVHRAGNAPSML